MTTQRCFHSHDYFIPAANDPLRTIILESPDCVIIAWHVGVGQRIAAHIHPHGQDTWTILFGSGSYIIDEMGSTQDIKTGDVVVALARQVHGVINNSDQPLRFISVVTPITAGYQLLEK